MTPIVYLNDLLNRFKISYPEFNKVKTSVGFTPTLMNINNFP